MQPVVAPRKGRVSRNTISLVKENAVNYVAPRKGRVSRNAQT